MRRWIAVPALAAVLVLPACGGGIGNDLTGGSVPTGGRAITGVAVLPDSAPAANATVQIRSLPAETLLQQTTTNGLGQFNVEGVATNADIDITVALPPQNVLETIVPQSTLAAGSQSTINIGNITATTSIVAAAIKLEQMNAPQDASGIIANQTMSLTVAVQGQHFSQNMQSQLISDRNNMNAQALTLMVPVANAELTTMYQSLTAANVSAALNGVLGYLRAAHSRNFQLTSSQRESLINAEVAGSEYSPAAVAAALQSAGVQVASQQIPAASNRERAELTPFAAAGSSISPLEAIVIAADITKDGGFQCDQNALNQFLDALLGNQ